MPVPLVSFFVGPVLPASCAMNSLGPAALPALAAAVAVFRFSTPMVPIIVWSEDR